MRSTDIKFGVKVRQCGWHTRLIHPSMIIFPTFSKEFRFTNQRMEKVRPPHLRPHIIAIAFAIFTFFPSFVWCQQQNGTTTASPNGTLVDVVFNGTGEGGNGTTMVGLLVEQTTQQATSTAPNVSTTFVGSGDLASTPHPQQLLTVVPNATSTVAALIEADENKTTTEQSEINGGTGGSTESMATMTTNPPAITTPVGGSPSTGTLTSQAPQGPAGTPMPSQIVDAAQQIQPQQQQQQNPSSGTAQQTIAANANSAANLGGHSPSFAFEAQPCTSEDCNGRGICVGTKAFPLCLCNAGATGTRCRDAPCDPGQNCNNRGWCLGTLSAATCFCNLGYSGTQCQFQSGK